MRLWKNIPLHLHIMGIFILLLVPLVAVLISVNTVQNTKAAMTAANSLLDAVSTSMHEKVIGLYDPAYVVVDTLSQVPVEEMRFGGFAQPMFKAFIELLEAESSLTALFIAWSDGGYYAVTRLKEREQAIRALSAPAKSAFAVQSIVVLEDETHSSTRWFFDNDLHLLAARQKEHVAYDPRLRGWYKQAQQSDTAMLSYLYLSATTKEQGLTVSRKLSHGDGVLGVNMALTSFLKFFEQQAQENSIQLFIFNSSEKVPIHSDTKRLVKRVTPDGESRTIPYSVDELADPVISGVYKEFLNNAMLPFANNIFIARGTEYIARVQPLPIRDERVVYLGTAVPLDTFTAPIEEAGRIAVFIAIAGLVLFFPVVFYASRRISTPLKYLADEAQRIGDFHLDGDVCIRSQVAEVKNLASAMDTMKRAVEIFGRYIPTTLVERMVRHGFVPEPGGERRELTVFFSDIANFTGIAEKMDPEELTGQISRYFECVGKEILVHNGTIDKYIGDAIMALWNAFDTSKNHAAEACLAAVSCQQAVEELNDALIVQGKPRLYTRIGLHTGETIVGNVGSLDRMNYTAMGATVNLASRLEGLNKYFGTSILVSESTMQQAGDHFLFRHTGRVLPKGATIPVDVFELMGLSTGEVGKTPTAESFFYRNAFEQALTLYFSRKFTAALSAFNEILARWPSDKGAALYAERAKQYTTTPPDEEWNGVEIFTEK